MDKKIRNIRKPHFLIGIAVLLIVEIVIVSFKLLFVERLAEQEHFQYWRIIVVQVIIITCAFLAPIILKWNLREVFPFKKPAARQIFGVILFFISSLILGVLVNMIIMYFFPTINSSNESFGFTLPVSLLLTAVTPAVCEEFFYRGFIQHTFCNVKNKWITVAVIGIIFGVVHWEVDGLFSRAILGVVLGYVMLETKNIILPMILHFLNNALVALIALNPNKPVTLTVYDPETAFLIGIMLICCAAVPFLLVWASRLLKTKEHNRENRLSKRTKWITALSTAFCLVAGICIVMLVD